jgi:C4-dicarboxylate transporter DctQ subunit
MRAALAWLNARAENLAVIMLAAMFATFILQIGGRYVLNHTPGWTLEFCLMMWVWVVFWGSAFCVRDRDHVKFDIFYAVAPRRVRLALAVVSAVAIVVAMLASLPATWDWVSFLQIKRSATLRIPLSYVFSVYIIFMVAIAVRYALRIVRMIREGAPELSHGGVVDE